MYIKCLFIVQVFYNATLLAFSSIVEKNSVTTPIKKAAHLKTTTNSYMEDVYEVQCFPLYSILLALGRTDVDYFSLDVEGSEYKILATIPWNKVKFKVRVTNKTLFTITYFIILILLS